MYILCVTHFLAFKTTNIMKSEVYFLIFILMEADN
jgi:hypothetical protein